LQLGVEGSLLFFHKMALPQKYIPELVATDKIIE
jgi:hypothetical protein